MPFLRSASTEEDSYIWLSLFPWLICVILIAAIVLVYWIRKQAADQYRTITVQTPRLNSSHSIHIHIEYTPVITGVSKEDSSIPTLSLDAAEVDPAPIEVKKTQ